MYLLLNGAFGVGKSQVAQELLRLVPGATIADPEPIGVLLHRLTARHRSDFQHYRLWRRLAVAWARWWGSWYSTVIIPMAFSDVSYLREVRAGLEASGQPVVHYCLTAPPEIVRQRLADRGEPFGAPRWAWVHRRAAECCAVHGTAAFAEEIPTAGRTAAEVAQTLAVRIATLPNREPRGT